MKRTVLTACLAAFGIVGVSAADTVELFGKADATWDAQVSPDGAHLALGCSPNGRLAVCIYQTGDTDARPKLVEPSSDQRLLGFYWAGDDHLVSNISFFENANTSSGIQELEIRRAIAYTLSRERSTMLMKEASNFTSLTGLKSVCDGKPGAVAMELQVRQEEEAATGSLLGRSRAGISTVLYDVDLDDGKMRVAESDRASVATYILDRNCDVVGRVLFNDQRQTFAIEIGTDRSRKTILEREGVPTVPMGVVGFTADRSGLIVDGYYGDLVGYHTLDVETGALAPLVINGREIGEAGLILSPYEDTILGYHFTNDLREEVFVEPTLAELQGMLAQNLSGKTITLRSSDRTGDRFTFQAQGRGTPAEFFLVDLVAGQIQPIGSEAPDVASRGTGAVEAVAYAARDGLQIPTYLRLPPGKSRADGPFPTILMPHGGPEARDTAAYDWWAQALAAEGYAVIQPNFRGSSGYGAAFRDRGFGEFGGAMGDDVVDAIAWAEAEGIAEPGGVCSVGASYGGYSALMTALRAPKSVGCVVAVAPVTDIFAHMGRFERGTSTHSYWARYVGGDTFSSDAEKRDLTPADRTTEFRAEILLLHGRIDRIVTPSQSEAFVDAWGERPGLRYVQIEGQDHYLTSTTARTTVLVESLAHLAAHHPAR